jgi:hypothetical protein
MAALTISAGQFEPGTVVSLVERKPARREDWQVTFAPDPRCPARRENIPPEELPVMATGTADVHGVNIDLGFLLPPYERFYWAIGWDELANGWKRIAVSHTPPYW